MTSNISSVADARPGVPTPTRRTVDAFTRTLHALLALSFAGAYVTAESEIFRGVHVSLGYTLGGLLLARVVWGLLGPRHARWSALWGKLRGLDDWLQGLRAGHASWSQAQNLYMAVSVGLILLAIAPVVVTGYVIYQEWTGDWMEVVHEFLGNFMLMAVLAHIGGVLALSVMRRRNLATPMLTGRVPGVGPDLIKRNHAVLAAALLAAVLSFWVWQWQSGPPWQATGRLENTHSLPGKAQSEADDD
jgi:cytochrome b